MIRAQKNYTLGHKNDLSTWMHKSRIDFRTIRLIYIN